MTEYIYLGISLSLGFLLSALSMPLIIYFSRKLKLYDTIDERKVHKGNISRLGGIGITLAFSVSVIILHFTGQLDSLKQNLIFVVVATVIITTMGIVDDIKTLSAKVKLLIQIAAAILVLFGDYKFSNISIGVYSLNIGYFAYPLTLIWIIGVTNAVNLLDGIDGQCGTVAILCSLTFCMFFFREGNTAAMAICLCFSCAILGFLLFNWPIPKARIFMGDGGSQTLGFVLSILPLMSSKGSLPSISIIYAAAALMIPIFDTFAAIWRRLREHRSIGSPDKYHIHHKLMLFGYSSRQTLLIVTLFQLVISIFLCTSLWLGGWIGTIILFTTYAMGIIFFAIVHYNKQNIIEHEMKMQ
ncbi:MAG: MraY family glycosyltransferase [Treponemataceae bacterium]|nr:MraY family glycosyltransferase [Spirochaetales bacterium]MDY6031552.1 MraY family glycosyltransferase [Treponemataceae bacterium]